MFSSIIYIYTHTITIHKKIFGVIQFQSMTVHNALETKPNEQPARL